MMRDSQYLFRKILALGSAVVAVASITCMTAFSAPVHYPKMSSKLPDGPPDKNGRIGKTLFSLNWSGYVVTDTPKYSSVSASWQEPVGTCHGGNQYSSFWVGFDGLRSKTVEQIGTEVDCQNKEPVYYAWYELYPAAPVKIAEPVKPKDRISASATATVGDSFTLKISDTGKWSVDKKVSLASAKRASAEVVVEAPCCTSSGGILPLADFGAVHFTKATADGAPLGNLKHIEIIMESGPVQEDKVSPMRHATDFNITWLHS
jgi:Peptidase A4 family